MVPLASFQVLNSHMWLVATKLNSADYRTFLPLQKVLLHSAVLENMQNSLKLSKTQM